jgi:hypothetical protein
VDFHLQSGLSDDHGERQPAEPCRIVFLAEYDVGKSYAATAPEHSRANLSTRGRPISEQKVLFPERKNAEPIENHCRNNRIQSIRRNQKFDAFLPSRDYRISSLNTYPPVSGSLAALMSVIPPRRQKEWGCVEGTNLC